MTRMPSRTAFATIALLLVHHAAFAGDAPSGAAIFAEKCAPCHQPDGTGAPGVAPPLVGTIKDYLKSGTGRQYLSQLLVTGMMGTITSQGVKYQGVMPPFGSLSDDVLSSVLHYVLTDFNQATPSDQTLIPSAKDIAHARLAGGTAASARQLRIKAKVAAHEK